MTTTDERPEAFMSAPVTVDRDPTGNLHLTASSVKPDALQRVGHRAVSIARAMIAADFTDPDDQNPPDLFVEVVVHYMW